MKEIQIATLILGLTGFCFSILLAFLSKKLKVEEDPRVERVLNILPGLNCGACGFSGCRPFAEAVTNKCEIFSGCLPGGSEMNSAITEILGITGCLSRPKQTAICRCGAESEEKKISSLYLGPQTCKAADIIGGALDCFYGCIGFGDCVKICPSNAISLKNKKIYIDFKKCTSCGKCLKSCPRNLFEIIPLKQDIDIFYIACNNKEKVLAVKKVCGKGCIGCGICTRAANAPYFLKDNLSYIDYTKTTKKDALEEGKNKCPTKCIFKIDV